LTGYAKRYVKYQEGLAWLAVAAVQAEEAAKKHVPSR